MLAVAAALAWAGPASADGDPASDVLLVDTVYLPYGGVSGLAEKTLRSTVGASAEAGYPVRVAVIAAPADLGAVTALWREPMKYARFLALELRILYKGPLVIVMPAGVGFAHVGRPVAAEYRALAGVRVEPGRDGLARTAASAVHALAVRAGHPFTAPSPSAGGSVLPWAIGAAAGGAAAAAAGALVLVRRRRSG